MRVERHPAKGAMRDPPHVLAEEGESRAEAYLRRRGYRILGRNVRSSSGELDLVADDQGVLVFVEVKGRRTEAFGGATMRWMRASARKLMQLAAQYLARHRIRDRACRFDVVLVQDHSERPRLAAYWECIRPRWGCLRWKMTGDMLCAGILTVAKMRAVTLSRMS